MLLILTSCDLSQTFAKFVDRDPIGYYLVGNAEERKDMQNFLTQLRDSDGDYETSFVLIQQIIRHLHAARRNDKQNLLLTTYVENHPEDPFNGYYLLIVADTYMEEEAVPFAVHYFERILKNHSDLLIQNQSIHYLCLSNLTRLVTAPGPRAEYYKELLSRFGEGQSESSPSMRVDMGLSYYNLAETYEELGEWDLAIQAYKNFLQYPDTVIPGFPEAHRETAEKVAFYDYRSKDWTSDNLEELVAAITGAIYSKNARRLNQYRAKVNFFAQYWEQQSPLNERDVADFTSNLGLFMVRRVTVARELDRDSNSQEAYLETYGWSYRIPTWYLYFHRISYPADPEINGRWQWAGIYFGEKPFSGTD